MALQVVSWFMSQAVMPIAETAKESRRSRPSLPGAPGWQPAHDDHSSEAVAWRATHAFNRSEETHERVDALQTSMDRLTKAMDTFSATTRTVLRWGLGIFTALFTAALIGAGAIAWHWVSTLHH
jgi:hypothetical protein